MNLQTSSRALQDSADATHQLGSDLINSAEHALQGTRELAGRSLQAAGEASARAQKQLSRYAELTSRYVANEPVKSVLIAAAVGALVAGVIVAARRR